MRLVLVSGAYFPLTRSQTNGVRAIEMYNFSEMVDETRSVISRSGSLLLKVLCIVTEHFRDQHIGRETMSSMD